MDRVNLITAVQRSWWWLLAGAILLGALSLIVSTRLTKTYQAESVLLVGVPSLSAGDSYGSILAAERVAQTYSELIVGRDNLELVIDSLGLSLTPDELKGKIRARVPADSRFINVSVRDHDPDMATAIVSELSLVFQASLASGQSEQETEDIANLRVQTARLRDEIAATEAAMDDLESGTTTAPGNAGSVELERLRERLRQAQGTYASLLDSLVQLQRLEQGGWSLSIAEPASDSPRVVSPNVLLNVSVGALAGLIAVFGLAIVRERVAPRIASRLDAARSLALPIYADVPRPEGDTREPISALFPGSAAAQRYGELLQRLRRQKLGSQAGALLVTTPRSPRYGNTLALNLGALLASRDTKVVVIDSNLKGRHVPRLFPLEDEDADRESQQAPRPTILEYLRGTSIEGLQIVAAGPSGTALGTNGTAAMAAIERLLPDIMRETNVVIVNAPPVTEGNGVAALAAHMDGVFLVIEAGETPVNAARKAKDTLTKAGARVMGVVVTDGEADQSPEGRTDEEL